MKISFLDFWDGFQPTNNFLFYLFREVYTNISVVDAINADLIIFSVFGNENERYNHCRKVFYTGENKRPDFTKCDYSITFDFDSHDGKNIRIPLWYYYIDWFRVGKYGNPSYLIPESYLYEPNEFSKKDKNRFCSAVYSNPVSFRNNFVNLLSQYKKIDCFGKIPGFYYLSDGEKHKLDTISNYKFNICFENTVYPGYYTEKLLHAKVAGCIPIYFQSDIDKVDFNKECFLNVNINDINSTIEKIIEIDTNFEKYTKIYSESIFTEIIDLENIKKELLKIK